jgi:hypothetical protein
VKSAVPLAWQAGTARAVCACPHAHHGSAQPGPGDTVKLWLLRRALENRIDSLHLTGTDQKSLAHHDVIVHTSVCQLCQRRITVGIQQCLHVAAANACMREWRAGLTVLCMLVPAHFLSQVFVAGLCGRDYGVGAMV